MRVKRRRLVPSTGHLGPQNQWFLCIYTSKVDLGSFWAPVRPLSAMHIHERIRLGSILGSERPPKSLNRTKQSKSKLCPTVVPPRAKWTWASSGLRTPPCATPLRPAEDLKPPSETHMRPHFRDQTNGLPRKMVYLLNKLMATLSYGHRHLTPAAGLREAS